MTDNPATHDEAFRQADKDHTGNAINARTDDMKTKLDSKTDRLQDEILDKDAEQGSTGR